MGEPAPPAEHRERMCKPADRFVRFSSHSSSFAPTVISCEALPYMFSACTSMCRVPDLETDDFLSSSSSVVLVRQRRTYNATNAQRVSSGVHPHHDQSE